MTCTRRSAAVPDARPQYLSTAVRSRSRSALLAGFFLAHAVATRSQKSTIEFLMTMHRAGATRLVENTFDAIRGGRRRVLTSCSDGPIGSMTGQPRGRHWGHGRGGCRSASADVKGGVDKQRGRQEPPEQSSLASSGNDRNPRRQSAGSACLPPRCTHCGQTRVPRAPLRRFRPLKWRSAVSSR
jgi:hypothetical protein